MRFRFVGRCPYCGIYRLLFRWHKTSDEYIDACLPCTRAACDQGSIRRRNEKEASAVCAFRKE
jgi:hypothetical protein